MKRQEILKIALGIIIFMAINHYLTALYTNVSMRKSILIRVEDQFRLSPYELPYLILGDSHCLFNINPAVFAGGFNILSGGENYIQTYYKLKYIIENDKKKLSTIILPLGLHSFEPKYIADIEHGWYWQNI